MSEKTTAYGSKSAEASYRKKWDLEAYSAKAKQSDQESYEHAKAAEKALQQGKKPPRIKPDLPKPTQALQARENDLEIEKNLNKTILVSNASGRGAGQPGFYCEICQRTLKDSIAYLDHVNGRSHLARLGQTTQVARSTLDQVRARIALLRSQSQQKVTSKNFDFEARLKLVREEEEKRLAEKKESRKRKREEKQNGGGGSAIDGVNGGGKVNGAAAKEAGGRKGLDEGQKVKGAFGNILKEEKKQQEEEDSMANMMGFGGFGGAKKQR